MAPAHSRRVTMLPVSAIACPFLKTVEVLVVRLTSWTILFLLLTTTGCNSLARRGGKSTTPASPAGLNGAPAPAADRIAQPTPPPVNASGPVYGVIAGQVLDTTNRNPGSAFIQVREVGAVATGNEAPIEVPVDRQGYFLIQGLQTGKRYELTARVNGAPELSGTTTATPPDARVLIKLAANQYAAPAPTPTPSPAYQPPPVNPTNGYGRAADLGPPVGIGGLGPPQPWGAPPAAQPAPPAPTPPSREFAPAPPVRPENVAENPRADLNRMMTTPNPYARPPAPAWQPAPRSVVQPPPPPPVVRPAPTAFDPGPARVPSCVLTGSQLYNFALNDVEGRPYELRRERRGRLVLIDFWGSWCLPCLRTIPKLTELQGRYGPYGLEVIGIAYEKGTHEENVRKIQHVRDRLRINYRLLEGSSLQDCPVKTQFGVRAWPTLVLVDETGRIIWRGEGADPAHLRELEIVIRQRLGV
ncbi:MAG: TlpA family protein disulfide reductase [Gemmataceae bacterium]